MRNQLVSIVRLCLLVLFASLTAACGGGGGGGGAPTLNSIEINPAAPALAKGTSMQLTAQAIYSDGTKVDVTNEVTWLSADSTVATIDVVTSKGRLLAHQVGTSLITASMDGKSATATATVTPAQAVRVDVTPADTSLAKGTTQALTATATFTDDSTLDVTRDASWSSDTPARAAVGNSGADKGRVTGNAVGDAIIRASFQGRTGTATVTVTPATLVRVEVSPATLSLAKGTEKALKAIAVFSDATTVDVTAESVWSSSATATVSVENGAATKGLAKALAVGSAKISAAYLSATGDSNLTVTSAEVVRVEISPPSPSIAKGTSQQLSATAIFTDATTQNVTAAAIWSSSQPAVATISNAAGSSGLAQAVAVGTTAIQASYQGVTATANLEVTPALVSRVDVTPSAPAIAKGLTQQFTAMAVFTDATTQDVTAMATWASADPAVASVSNAAEQKGLAQGLSVGSSEISASFQGLSGRATLKVSAATVVRLEISPTAATLAKGTARQFSATAVFTDNSTQTVTKSAAWTSSDTGVATVGNAADTAGFVQSVKQGTAEITAAHAGFDAKATLTVTPAVLVRVDVTPVEAQIPLGRTQQFTATGVYSDSTTQNLTDTAAWTSSDTGVLEVGNAAGAKGLAAARAVGTATIKAAVGDLEGSSQARVTAAALTSIQIAPANSRVAASFEVPFQATGLFSDGSRRDVTADVTWGTVDASIATISNASGSKGVATGLTAGTTGVTAQQGGVSASTLLTVTSATLSSIEVSPSSLSLPLGLKQQYRAIGSFSDGSTQDITVQVTWSSEDAGKATVSNAPETAGLVTSVATGGPLAITASREAIAGAASLTVSNAALVSIAVTPATATIPKGTQQQFKATGSFTDNSTADITASVTWGSSDAAIVNISNADAERGLATGLTVGSVTINAIAGTVSGSTSLSVSPAVLRTLVVTPEIKELAKGLKQQFKATGSYSDSSVRDITAEVTWSSSDATIASISNAAIDAGLASTLKVGEVTISAASGEIADTATLTVSAATLTDITIEPVGATVAAGLSVQLSATGHFTDGGSESLTDSVTWESSDPGIAEVSNGVNTRGLAYGKASGSATIRAIHQDSGIVGAIQLAVSPAVLMSITVSPTGADTPVGFFRQYQAFGQFSDGIEREVTAQVSWSTVDPEVLVFETRDGSSNWAKAVSVGATTVIANLGGVTGTTSARGVSASLLSIAVTPADSTIARDTTLQFSAQGSFAGGLSLPLTTQVTWTSSNTRAATISNAEGSKGLATAGTLLGTTTISATAGATTGSTTLRRVVN